MTATASARMYPILPCRDLDEAIGFYEALGFERLYRQIRPNPPAVVARDELQVHLAGIENFDPEGSATLERALAKHADAQPIDRARALAYRADLAIRLDRRPLARASLDEIATLDRDDDERASLKEDLDHVEALLR